MEKNISRETLDSISLASCKGKFFLSFFAFSFWKTLWIELFWWIWNKLDLSNGWSAYITNEFLRFFVFREARTTYPG